jgi:hypothetical protein
MKRKIRKIKTHHNTQITQQKNKKKQSHNTTQTTKHNHAQRETDEVAPSYAVVYGLTKHFNSTGTSLFLEKETGWSNLKTLAMNERAQGNSNPHNPKRFVRCCWV